jgi:hypothetical protein
MTKLVVNRRHGGFGLSPKAERRYLELVGKDCYFYKQTQYAHNNNGVAEYTRIPIDEAKQAFIAYTLTKDIGEIINDLPNDETYWYNGNLERDDPILIKVVEEMGEEANGDYSNLEIVEIPDDVVWEIDDYDGYETVHETHRSW